MDSEQSVKESGGKDRSALQFFRVEFTLLAGTLIGLALFFSLGAESLNAAIEAVQVWASEANNTVKDALRPTNMAIMAGVLGVLFVSGYRLRSFILIQRSDVPERCPECNAGIRRVRSKRYHKWLQKIFYVAIRCYGCRECTYRSSFWRLKLDPWPHTDRSGRGHEGKRRRRRTSNVTSSPPA